MAHPSLPPELDQFFATAGNTAERGLFEQALGSALSGIGSADTPASPAAGVISQTRQAVFQKAGSAVSKGAKKNPTEKKEPSNIDAMAFEPTPCILPVPSDSPATFAAGPPMAGAAANKVVPDGSKSSTQEIQGGGPRCSVPVKAAKRVSGRETKQSEVEDSQPCHPSVRILGYDSPEQRGRTEPPSPDPSAEPGQNQPGRDSSVPSTGAATPRALLDELNESSPSLVAPSLTTWSVSLQQELPGLSPSVSDPGLPPFRLAQTSQIPDVATAVHQPACSPLAETPQLTPVSLPHLATVAPQVNRIAKYEPVHVSSEQATNESKFMSARSQDGASSPHELRVDATLRITSAGQNVNPPAPAGESHETPQSMHTQARNAERGSDEPGSDQSKPNPQTLLPAAVIQSPAETSSISSMSAMPSQPASTPILPIQPSPARSQSTDISPSAPLHDLQQITPPSALPLQVHAARIVQNDDLDEMRLDVRTQAFGSVEIRTTVSGKDVQLAVNSEHGDLRSFLAPEMPGLQNSLQQHDMRLEQVRTLLHGGTMRQFSSGSDRQQQHFSRPHSNSIVFDPPTESAGNVDEEEYQEGLNIRI